MKAIIKFLASFGSDKYLHLVVGMLIAGIVFIVDAGFFHRTPDIAAGIALTATFFIAIAKETYDIFSGTTVLPKDSTLDVLFTMIGSACIALILYITYYLD